MAHRLSQLAALAVAPVLAPSLAQAQEHMFRTWFEAPDTVLAGETFQVWLWATYEVDGQTVPPDEHVSTYLYGVYGSVEIAGDLPVFASISPILDGLYRLDSGTSDGAWLHEFVVFQTEEVPGFYVDFCNPLAMAMFEVTTTASTHGDLEIHLRPPSNLGVPYVGWWDGPTSDWIATNDPGVGLFAESITVRVIPAPAALGVLALMGIGAARRRHRTQYDRCRCRCR